MKILTNFKENIGHYDPKETKGLIEISYYNLSDIINPYEPKGSKEKVYYEIALNNYDIDFIESLYNRLKPMKKYNYNFLLSLCIFITSKIIKKAIFKVLEDLKI